MAIECLQKHCKNVKFLNHTPTKFCVGTDYGFLNELWLAICANCFGDFDGLSLGLRG